MLTRNNLFFVYVRYLEMLNLVAIVLRKYLFTDLYLHSFSDNPDHFVTLLSIAANIQLYFIIVWNEYILLMKLKDFCLCS